MESGADGAVWEPNDGLHEMYVSSATPTPENPRVSSFVEQQHHHHTHHLRRPSDLPAQQQSSQHAYDQAFYAVQIHNQSAHSGDQQQLYNFEMMDHSRRQQYSDAGSSIATGHAMVHHDSSISNSSPYVSSPSSQSVSNTTPSTTTSGSVTTSPGKTRSVRKLELVDKQQICLFAQENPKTRQEDIGRLFNVDRSTVSKVLKKKNDFLSSEGGSGPAVGGGGDDKASTSSSLTSKYPELKKKLALWAYHTISQGVIVTDQMLQDQAKESAKVLGIGENNFRASHAGVAKFKNRQYLVNGKFTDEGLEMIRQMLNEQQQQSKSPSEEASRTQHLSNESIYSPLQEAMPNIAISHPTSTNQMPFPLLDSDHTSRHINHYELNLQQPQQPQQQQQFARTHSFTMAPPVAASSSVATSPTRSQNFPGEFHSAPSSAAAFSANLSPEMYELKADHTRLGSARKRTSPAQRSPYPSPRERHHLRSQSHHLLGSQLVAREQQAQRLSELDSLRRQMVTDKQQQAALMSSASQQRPMNISLSALSPTYPITSSTMSGSTPTGQTTSPRYLSPPKSSIALSANASLPPSPESLRTNSGYPTSVPSYHDLVHALHTVQSFLDSHPEGVDGRV